MPEPKNAAGYRIGIVNPLTLVGTEIQTILRERSFPLAKTVLLATGESAGTLTEADGEPVYVQPVSDDELEDLDLVFSAARPRRIGSGCCARTTTASSPSTSRSRRRRRRRASP